MPNLRLARKPHVCTLCGYRIHPGTRYVYWRYMPWSSGSDGQFSEVHSHAICDEAWTEDSQYGDEYGGDEAEFCRTMDSGGDDWRREIGAPFQGGEELMEMMLYPTASCFRLHSSIGPYFTDFRYPTGIRLLPSRIWEAAVSGGKRMTCD